MPHLSVPGQEHLRHAIPDATIESCILVTMGKPEITFENVMTVANYVDALKACKKSVGYKLSVQNYMRHGLIYIADTLRIIRAGRIPKVQNTEHITITERGHKRIITPIRISDRVTQRVLCDCAIIPLIKDRLIYDNGASTKGKGTDFSRKRFNEHLEKAKRRWGADNIYVLKFDFKSFFASIPHAQCYRVLDEIFEDKRLRDLAMGIIESYQEADILRIKDPQVRERELRSLRNHEKIGICLGSQLSQIMALLVPNKFDHYVKDKLGLEFYVRHMDDGVILFNDKDELLRIKDLLTQEAARYGLTMSPSKTYVTKLTKGFTFLKVRYRTDGDRTVKTLAKGGIVRMRRKLKKFGGLMDRNMMRRNDVYASVQSWTAHAAVARSFHTVRAMLSLYDDLFGGYRLTRRFWKQHQNLRRKRKVVRI